MTKIKNFMTKEKVNEHNTLNEKILVNPTNAELFNMRARFYYTNKFYNDSASDWEKALELDPGNAIYHRCAGAAYLCNKDFYNSELHLNKAIQLDPQELKNHSWKYNLTYNKMLKSLHTIELSNGDSENSLSEEFNVLMESALDIISKIENLAPNTKKSMEQKAGVYCLGYKLNKTIKNNDRELYYLKLLLVELKNIVENKEFQFENIVDYYDKLTLIIELDNPFSVMDKIKKIIGNDFRLLSSLVIIWNYLSIYEVDKVATENEYYHLCKKDMTEIIDKAIKDNSNNFFYYHVRADFSNNIEEIINDCKKMISIDSLQNYPYFKLFRTYYNQCKYKDAVDSLRELKKNGGKLELLNIGSIDTNKDIYQFIFNSDLVNTLSLIDLVLGLNDLYSYYPDLRKKLNICCEEFDKLKFNNESLTDEELVNISFIVGRSEYIYNDFDVLMTKIDSEEYLNLNDLYVLSSKKKFILTIKYEMVKNQIADKLIDKNEDMPINLKYKCLKEVDQILNVLLKEISREDIAFFKQQEAEKTARENAIKASIFQAVSHTLGNMLNIENNSLDNILQHPDSNEIKRLKLNNLIMSSIVLSIGIAFSDKSVINSKTQFFSTADETNISLRDILLFCLNLNLNYLLTGSGKWQEISKLFFEGIETINDIPQITELNHSEIENFYKFLLKQQYCQRNFAMELEPLQNIFIEKNSYTFAIVFVILNELIKNMFKYGTIRDLSLRNYNISATNQNGNLVICFGNTARNNVNSEGNTLQGLNMVQEFAKAFGWIEKNESIMPNSKYKKFEIKLIIDKKAENNESVVD